ncbi:uncharacterized protein [Rutidosis leptorrhynchoides]|uniref:uncharacterized protein n=1 Tax=Rutidosis leptorrhynchoides TaxID=125765 RepID=UPI003A991B06
MGGRSMVVMVELTGGEVVAAGVGGGRGKGTCRCNWSSKFDNTTKVHYSLRQMAYGTIPDLFDEYIKIGEKTATLCLDNFCKCVFHLFGREYLRKPTAEDIARLYNFHAQKHGLPGMLGSIDCANNNINVLNYSPLFNIITDGTAPPSPFDINGHHYDRGYYLGDGIYPDWAMLGRFAMLKTPARSLDFNKIRRHMYACIELYDMIQENNDFVIGRREERMIQRNPPRWLERDLTDPDARLKEIRDKEVHKQLEADLTEHVWNLSPYSYR